MSDDLIESTHAAGLTAAENETIQPCCRCATTKSTPSAARLMTRGDVDQHLALSAEQVTWLIRTGQVTKIRMRGEERFDRRDLDRLIENYKTALRRIGNAQGFK